VYETLLSIAANWFTIFGLLVGAAALVVAAVQIRNAARTTQAQLILMIDDSLRPYEEIRARINGSDPQHPAIRMRRYIARFERIGILLETEQISLDKVNQLYGVRIEKLLQHPDAKALLASDPEGWQGVTYLWQAFYEKGYPGRTFEAPLARKVASPVAEDDETGTSSDTSSVG
jgi:hypothetical protein